MSGSKKILVVDDDEIVREFLVHLLEPRGWEVYVAQDGDEAVSLALKELPDVIILDIVMPGKDGIMVFKELVQRPETVHIPVIFLTSVNEVRLGQQIDIDFISNECGSSPAALLEKPVNSNVLLELLARILL